MARSHRWELWIHYEDFLHGVVWTLSFPEFVAVGTMDEVQFFHFDSNTQRIVPKPARVDQLTRDDPDYLERETGYLVSHQQDFQGMLKTQKERFNQRGGKFISNV